MAYIYGLGALSIPDLISSSASRYGVPPSLALAVAQRESGLNQSARGAAGEIGVFQLMPGTAGDLGVNPSNLEENIEGGIRYLRQMFDRFGDWGIALQAYNGGQGNVARGTVSSAARSYAASVLAAAGLQDQSEEPFWYSGAEDLSEGLSGAAIAGIAIAAFAGLYLLTD